MKIQIKGPIVSDGEQWIYDWFDIPATSPAKVSKVINNAIQNNVKELTVVINSGGGSVFSASEIYTALKSFKGKVHVEIVGVAASAASVIAMAGTKISMSPTAQLMIHNATTFEWGDYRDMDHTSEFLQNVNKSIMNAYISKTGKTEEELKAMMDKETWFTAQQALEHNFIDEVMFEDEVAAVASKDLIHGPLPKEVIEKVRNELLQKAKGSNAVGKANSNLEPVATAVCKNKEGERKDMDLEKLKNDYPDLYEQVRNEGYEDGFQKGIEAENARIKEIEDLAIPGNEKLVNRAKFEDKKMTAAQLAIEIIKAQKQQGANYLNNRKEDAKDLNDVEGSFAPQDYSNEKQKEQEVANEIAKYMNAIRGGN